MGTIRRRISSEFPLDEEDMSRSRHHHHHHQAYHHNQHRYLHYLVIVALFNLFQLAVGNPVFVNNPSLAHFQSGRNIRHLPCIVRRSGLEGVCMFAIDCIKSNGTHLGTCIDRFYFGSCCQMKDESLFLAHEISDNSIDQNTISHFQHESTTSVPVSGLFKLTTTASTYSSTLRTSNNKTEQLNDQIKNVDIETTSNNLIDKKDQTTMVSISNEVISTSTTKPAKNTMKSTSKPLSSSLSSSSVSSSSSSTSTTRTTPITRTTSTSKPSVLTTTAHKRKTKPTEISTTEPGKISTFQMVQNEPTTITATELTTKQQPPQPTVLPQSPTTTKRTTKRPTTQRTEKPTKRTSSTSRPTTIPPVVVTTTTRRPQRTTTTRLPTTTVATTTTRRPISSRRPTVATKRPTIRPRPTKRPTTTTSSSPSTSSNRRNTTQSHVPTTTKPFGVLTTIKVNQTLNATSTTTTSEGPISTMSFVQTTKAPRPKPKPTSHIVKITSTTTKNELQNKNVTTSVVKVTSNKTITSSTTHKNPNTVTTTKLPEITTKKTAKPEPVTTVKPIEKTTETPTSTKKPLTTSKPSTLSQDSTTLKPGLVTWTNLDELKNTTSASSNDTSNEVWKPLPKPDWVPLPTIKPDNNFNKTVSDSNTTLSTGTQNTTEVSITEGNEEKLPEILSSTPSLLSSSSTSSSKPPITTESSKPSFVVDATPSRPITFPSNEPTDRPPFMNISSTESESTSTSSTTFFPPWFNITQFPAGRPNATSSTPSSTAPIPGFEGIDYRQICGKRMFPEPRIVGGANAAFGKWPWQISLRQWRTSTYLHKCGAALLNENWAITAAHCVDNVPPADLLLRLGEYDLAEEEEPYGYQERRVQIVASHPQFDPRTFEYDLALLRFYEPVIFQPNIIPVCVPDSDENFIGQTAFVTGWGRLYEDGPLPSVLQEVSVPVINNTICETMYRSAGYIEHIPHIFICAGWKNGGYDSCEGDSGGPMVLQREDKRFLLAGVISWGIGCAEPNQPGVYTRISEFRDWINQILQF